MSTAPTEHPSELAQQDPEQSHSRPVAHLHRMVMDKHTCPFGLKARDLLQRKGFHVEDRPLTSREQVDAFKREHDVATTPQIFIDGERIGGYDALRAHLGEPVKDKSETSYEPVIAIFAVAFLMAMAVASLAGSRALSGHTVQLFVAISVCILAIQKLQDIERFSTMFLNYDVLAQRWVRYGYVYPFLEAGAGVLMIAGALTWLAAPVMIVIGGIGAWSVFKAVVIDKRELKCACVGGNSNVPLGFVSLTENGVMLLMGVWALTTGF